MKIRCPGGRLAGQVLKVLEHEVQFAENGIAEAGHLTDAEIDRLLRFGFHMVHEPKEAHAAPPAAAPEPELQAEPEPTPPSEAQASQTAQPSAPAPAPRATQITRRQ